MLKDQKSRAASHQFLPLRNPNPQTEWAMLSLQVLRLNPELLSPPALYSSLPSLITFSLHLPVLVLKVCATAAWPLWLTSVASSAL